MSAECARAGSNYSQNPSESFGHVRDVRLPPRRRVEPLPNSLSHFHWVGAPTVQTQVSATTPLLIVAVPQANE